MLIFCTPGTTTFVSTELRLVAIGANNSAPASFTFCHARSIFSDAVSVSLYTESRAPELLPVMAVNISWKDSWPICAALNISIPARLPKIFIASALVTVPSCTPWTNSLNPSCALFPSFVQLATPFFMPARTADVFAPLFSNCASMAMDSSVENPSSLKLAAFCVTDCASLPTSIPDCCPATVNLSRVSA